MHPWISARAGKNLGNSIRPKGRQNLQPEQGVFSAVLLLCQPGRGLGPDVWINPERKQILSQRSCRVCPVGPRQLLMAAPAQRGHHPGWGQPAQPWDQSRDTRLSLPLLAGSDFRFQLELGIWHGSVTTKIPHSLCFQ